MPPNCRAAPDRPGARWCRDLSRDITRPWSRSGMPWRGALVGPADWHFPVRLSGARRVLPCWRRRRAARVSADRLLAPAVTRAPAVISHGRRHAVLAAGPPAASPGPAAGQRAASRGPAAGPQAASREPAARATGGVTGLAARATGGFNGATRRLHRNRRHERHRWLHGSCRHAEAPAASRERPAPEAPVASREPPAPEAPVASREPPAPRGTAGTTGGAGATGTGPCAGLCDNPTTFTTASYSSGNVGTGAACFETTANIHGRKLQQRNRAADILREWKGRDVWPKLAVAATSEDRRWLLFSVHRRHP